MIRRIGYDKKIQKCDVCEAPYRNPLTEGWHRTETKVGTATYVTVHRPDCAMVKGGLA